MLVPSSFAALSTQGPPGITPGSAFVNPRIVMGAAAIVIASILLLLYLYRRRLFILWWISGWILLAASMFLVARPYLNQKLGWMAYGTSQFLGILSSLAFVVAADAYRHRPLLRREYGLVLLPVAIWFTLAPVPLGPVRGVRAGARAHCRRAGGGRWRAPAPAAGDPDAGSRTGRCDTARSWPA